MPTITKELAQKIARKLKAQIHSKGRHDFASIYFKGKMIASFGIRRGSKKDSGHDYVPEQLFIKQKEALQLGRCPLSREEWLSIIRAKGKLPDE